MNTSVKSAVTAFLVLLAAPVVCAQAREVRTDSPSDALSSLLVAACRQNAEQFARFQTRENAAAFQQLRELQKIEIMRRFVQVEEAGKPLLTSDPQGRVVIRCETPSITVQLRLGDERTNENLAFVAVDINEKRRAEFGLVKEAGGWRVLSVGLLLFNLPQLVREWESQGTAPPGAEDQAIECLQRLREAILKFQRAFGELPAKLSQLGPPEQGEGVSPAKARLVDEQLASGRTSSYLLDLIIVPGRKPEEPPAFALLAKPIRYGGGAQRSFYLDAAGILRGADKKGAEATTADPVIEKQ